MSPIPISLLVLSCQTAVSCKHRARVCWRNNSIHNVWFTKQRKSLDRNSNLTTNRQVRRLKPTLRLGNASSKQPTVCRHSLSQTLRLFCVSKRRSRFVINWIKMTGKSNETLCNVAQFKIYFCII